MKHFLKNLAMVIGLTLVCLGIALVIPDRQEPKPIASAGDEAMPTELSGHENVALDTEPGRTPEYDYDPPVPGSYELPILQDASDGTVIAPDGRPVRLHDLLDGRVAILSFIYTRCTDPRACLRASGVLSELQQLSRKHSLIQGNLQLITLSFDPAFDTPEVMERYGRVFSRGEGGADWLFLTTRNRGELEPLLEAYGQRVDKRNKPSALGPYQHTLRVYLIDTEKRIRNIYSYGLLDPRLVMADVRTLLMEKATIAKN